MEDKEANMATCWSPKPARSGCVGAYAVKHKQINKYTNLSNCATVLCQLILIICKYLLSFRRVLVEIVYLFMYDASAQCIIDVRNYCIWIMQCSNAVCCFIDKTTEVRNRLCIQFTVTNLRRTHKIDLATVLSWLFLQNVQSNEHYVVDYLCMVLNLLVFQH